MCLQRQITALMIVAASVVSLANLQAAATNDTDDTWNRHQQKLAAVNALWQDTNVSLRQSLPTNLQNASDPPARVDAIAYWGWYGPGYGYGYWGPRPYRYYGGYVRPYNAYYGAYSAYAPGYYYGPRVGARVYPYGRVWGGYW